MSPRDVLRAWVSLREPVDRRFYLVSGLTLSILKYAIDAGVVWITTGVVWTPFFHAHPAFHYRERALGAEGTTLVWTLAVWTLPFVWIGASMTVRRAIDAGFSPWVGALFFVPIVNYLVMVMLALLPSWAPSESPAHPPASRVSAGEGEGSMTPLGGIASSAAGTALGFVLATLSILGVGYGASLFLGAPFLMGMISAYLYNRVVPRSALSTLMVAEGSLLLVGGVLALIALEGLMCLLMALPIGGALAALGAILGHTIARRGHPPTPSFATLALALPLIGGIEALDLETPVRSVTTTIVVDAPPERVWPNVIGFSTLPPPTELVFALGIAHPLRARIDGAGVGAIRHCEFSTGAFVEPITAWEPPRRLAFDVASQPPSMDEWSPYEEVHAAHLADGFHALRGEFRLVALDDGRTRVEGTTWYRSRIFPELYWKLWSDWLLHTIHHRVLAHVKHLSES